MHWWWDRWTTATDRLGPDAHQATFFFINGDGLVKHLGEDIDDAGNFVGH